MHEEGKQQKLRKNEQFQRTMETAFVLMVCMAFPAPLLGHLSSFAMLRNQP